MIKLHTRYSPVPVVFVSGRVEGEDANHLKSTLLDLVDRGYDSIALELGEALALDNSGIGALLTARGRVAQIGGDLSLVNCSAPVLEDLGNTGMMDIFNCYERLDEVPEPQ